MKKTVNKNNYYEKEDTTIKDYFENLSQQEIERMDVDDFLIDCVNEERDIVIIRGEDWDEFHNTDDEEYEMKLEYTDGIKFYEKFKEMTEIGFLEFDKCFVSAKYIDENTDNCMNLIVKVNGINQRFVIDRD